jgi:hypothetical protein
MVWGLKGMIEVKVKIEVQACASPFRKLSYIEKTVHSKPSENRP